MVDLMKSADPASGQVADTDELRAKVEERMGIDARLSMPRSRSVRPLVIAVIAFTAVLIVAVPAILRREASGPVANLSSLASQPGIDAAVALASGGVQSAAADGDHIWALSSFAHVLQDVSVSRSRVEAEYPIEPYAEGVVVGGGYVWMFSYDDGGAVLRFDPRSGRVDKTVPLGGSPGWARWYADRLWVSNDRGQLLQIDSDGQVVDVGSGELKGDGLGLLWVNDPDTGLISSVSGDGTVGEIVIPTDGTITPTGSGVRSVAGAGGYLWLMDDDHPNGSAVTRFDPRTGELTPLPITVGLVGMAGFEDGLWMTSSTDDLVAKVDPETGEVHRFPVPGKLGGLLVADGSLWVMLHQFGALVRLDTSGDLVESGDVFYEGGVDGHRLLCTGDPASSGPTILLEPYEWVDYGSWSVVQARLAAAGQRVCTHGYLEEEVGPERRADDLRAELAAANIPGPYVLVAAGDGVHAVRLFADGRDDIAGVVLVDPMALNFSAFYDETVPNLTEHPPWGNLATTVALGLGGLGDIPLVVIGHDPDAAYLSPQFVAAAGSERSNLINDFWQEGLRYYAGLTPVSSILEASGSGTMVIWDDPDFVVDSIIDVATP